MSNYKDSFYQVKLLSNEFENILKSSYIKERRPSKDKKQNISIKPSISNYNNEKLFETATAFNIHRENNILQGRKLNNKMINKNSFTTEPMNINQHLNKPLNKMKNYQESQDDYIENYHPQKANINNNNKIHFMKANNLFTNVSNGKTVNSPLLKKQQNSNKYNIITDKSNNNLDQTKFSSDAMSSETKRNNFKNSKNESDLKQPYIHLNEIDKLHCTKENDNCNLCSNDNIRDSVNKRNLLNTEAHKNYMKNFMSKLNKSISKSKSKHVKCSSSLINSHNISQLSIGLSDNKSSENDRKSLVLNTKQTQNKKKNTRISEAKKKKEIKKNENIKKTKISSIYNCNNIVCNSVDDSINFAMPSKDDNLDDIKLNNNRRYTMKNIDVTNNFISGPTNIQSSIIGQNKQSISENLFNSIDILSSLNNKESKESKFLDKNSNSTISEESVFSSKVQSISNTHNSSSKPQSNKNSSNNSSSMLQVSFNYSDDEVSCRKSFRNNLNLNKNYEYKQVDNNNKLSQFINTNDFNSFCKEMSDKLFGNNK